jgi:peptidoglycan/xylan/chitin deacetylase (PgdA/CDA1 family)
MADSSPAGERPGSGWLGGHRAAVMLGFDVDAETPLWAADPRCARDAMAMTHQAFGPRVGVPRILQLLADLGVPATFFIPGVVAERYPETVEAVAAAGHEIGHHSHGHRPPATISADEERRDFERALEALGRLGVTPRGHRAAMWQASWQTPSLVAEYGLVYDSSLMDDDRPYLLETPRGTIAELPPHWSLDDWEQFAFLPDPPIGASINSPVVVGEQWRFELDAMRRHRCLFALTCHPFLSGRAGRVELLRGLLEHAQAAGDVVFLSASEVAQRAFDADDTVRRTLTPVEAPTDVYGASLAEAR